MPAAWIADALLLLHAAFIAWVLAGALLVWRWPRCAWLHLPAVAWGVWIEASGGICPLTPLENQWRAAAGEAGYAGSFIEHWLGSLIYPEGLTRELQWLLATALLMLNVLLYGAMILRRWRQ